MEPLYESLFIFILLRFLAIHPVLAALPDLVVRFTPSTLSESYSLAGENGNDASIEILAKRAEFGSRHHSLEGTIVRPPDYDSFLCERYKRTVNIDKYGNSNLVVLPPYPKPDEKDSTVMLVPRGECSFERKAYAAKHFYGAKGIMIYDRLGARYGWNASTDSVIFPQDKLDYDCANGNSVMKNLPLDPPAYKSTDLDLLMGSAGILPTNTTSLMVTTYESPSGGSNAAVDMITSCNLTNTALKTCESQLCLVTSHLKNSTDYPVCCAWDSPVTMPKATDAQDLDTDDIFALWITIRQAELFFQSDLLSFQSDVLIEARGSRSAFNATYVIMWIWGTLVMMVGAWYAARDYRIFGYELTAYKAGEVQNQTRHLDRDRTPHPSRRTPELSIDETKEQMDSKKKRNRRVKDGDSLTRDDLESGQQSFQDEDMNFPGENTKQTKRIGKNKKAESSKKKSRQTKKEKEIWSLHSLPPSDRKKKKKALRKTSEQIADNATMNQAIIEEGAENETSVIPARKSGTITPLELTQWHVLVFVVITSSFLVLLFYFKIYNVIFVLHGIGCAGAICYLVLNPLVAKVVTKLGRSWVAEFNKPVICGCNGFRITGQLIGYTWVGIWIWYGITHYRPQTNAFFWISLNIFGACLCILFVSLAKLTSIKIATILLIAVFLYDIFFVFITPFFTPDGTSIMLKVVAGSEDPSGEDFCYKYPDDRWCKGIGFLPMLFIFPKINDYASGSVLLGLGDIIFPGFLIAFSARHDEAARLVGSHMTNLTNSDVKIPTKWYEGYFFPMLMAYSLGLFFAFVAVILMKQGQPALLYICPTCLMAIFVIGRRDLKNMWNGAKVLKQADSLIAKTERKWGKARMKEFAERRRRENATLATHSENELDPKQYAVKKSTEILPEASTKSGSNSSQIDQMQPRSRDICFEREDHPGTRAFRIVVKQVAAEFDDVEYKPEVFKVIKRRLQGRRFFVKKKTMWEESSKIETRKQIGKAYDRVRGSHSAVLDG